MYRKVATSDEDLYVGCIETVNTMSEWYEEIKIHQKVVKFQLDAGARCNVMSLQTFHQIGIKAEFTKPFAKSICITEVLFWSCDRYQRSQNTASEYKGNLYQVTFYIVNLVPAVLSASTCAEMGLVIRIHTVISSSTQVPLHQQTDRPQVQQHKVRRRHRPIIQTPAEKPDRQQVETH